MYLHNPDRLTMSVEEAGKLLGIGRSSAYGAIRRGELPSFKIGRRMRGAERTGVTSQP